MRPAYLYTLKNKDGSIVLKDVSAQTINNKLGLPKDFSTNTFAAHGSLLKGKYYIEISSVVGNPHGVITYEDRRHICRSLFTPKQFDEWVTMNRKYGTRWKKQ